MIRAIFAAAVGLMALACGVESTTRDATSPQAICGVFVGQPKVDVQACLGSPLSMIAGVNGGHVEESWFYSDPSHPRGAEGRPDRVNFVDGRVVGVKP